MLKIVFKFGGRIKDIYFYLFDLKGIGEVRVELEVENGKSIILEFKRFLKGGRFFFRIFSEV